MHRVLEEAGKKVILLGNEAIVRGALEAGVGFASAYPGTPSSEVPDTFFAISEDLKKRGIQFEYSTNEKVAVEAASGAAFSGVKSIVGMKHFGLNVASDAVFPLAYHGVKAGMVIMVADDPSGHSSGQSEEDSRYFARLAHMPLLEPSDSTECRDFTKIAFELSERFKIPVLIRTTTRVSHGSGVVTLGKIIQGETRGYFKKGEERWRTIPPKILEVHKELHETMEKIRQWGEEHKINFVVNSDAKSSLGIITSGVSFQYVMESLKELDLKVPVLKLSLTYPFPSNKIQSFMKNIKEVLIVEELEGIVEEDVKALAKDVNPKIEIHGKDMLPVSGEYKVELVEQAIARLAGKKIADKKKVDVGDIIKRPPSLCPGCPHRASFYAAKKAAPNAVFGGDIGCYLIGIFPPQEQSDWITCMGGGEGISHGVSKVSDQKVISFVGDSTFFHSGIPPLINMIYNKSNPVVIALDNRWTAMTGHQPHPGTGVTGMHETAKEMKIDEIAKACGVENVAVVNCFNVNEMTNKVHEFLEKKKTGVIVAKGECRLQFMRKMRKAGTKVPVFEIDTSKCIQCGTCLYKFGCPAIHREEPNGKFYIDSDMCWGCGVCPQICPTKAIKVKE